MNFTREQMYTIAKALEVASGEYFGVSGCDDFCKSADALCEEIRKELSESNGKTEGLRSDLKPCPFCGGEAHYDAAVERQGGYATYYVFCRYCGAETAMFSSIPDAVAAWNRRAGEGRP